ncbi:MAG TPA: DEAD/DEAH box helicase family protein [Draconibacterium sp.]|nr:DEAD/DEAH box helicase family protein [Draconibacterium sp.]
MKLQFDKNQHYQLKAIQSVIDLFDGQPALHSDFEFSFDNKNNGSIQFNDAGVGNKLVLTEDELLVNLNKVQRENELREDEISTTIEKIRYSEYSTFKEKIPENSITAGFPNFSVEMETGTGKTYVYLRLIYELSKVYGFKKFVIVVPSVAIREGVVKSLQITFGHFQEIYNKLPVEYRVYDAFRITELDKFAKSNTIQILVINIDSFAKDANIINQLRESGIKPIEYIQKSNPIVIIDEPQNMETDIRKRAVSNLNPLFTLRFSATHKNLYNLVYKLDPVKAYELGLVKQIEVDSVVTKNENPGAFISVDSFRIAKNSISAKISIFINEKSGVVKKQLTAKVGDDLYVLSKNRDIYSGKYVINEINTKNQFIEFSNGQKVYRGQAVGGLTDQILREMVDATVENHFKKEKELKGKGIKVLSVFFVDRVANYRQYDDLGNPNQGKFAEWFEKSYTRWQNMPDYKGLLSYRASDVHDGYFSQDKSGKLKDSKETNSTKADDETYSLIMRDKERLLDEKVPLRFIFSHSALREGWDNPNVFQICTLNETRSEVKKRQEIGRGLRLCVDQTGTRIIDRSVNRLTVIANEAYESFSKSLQKEIEEDCGVKFEGRIKNARARTKVFLKNKWKEDELFLELWDKIRTKTEYKVNFSTSELIEKCVSALKNMPKIERPVIYREKNLAGFMRDSNGQLLELSGELKNSEEKIIVVAKYDIPDLVAYIQSKTELTRNTITEIILRSNRLDEIFINPQLFMDNVVHLINDELEQIKFKNIQYEKVDRQFYDLEIFESGEKDQYLDNLIEVKNQTKTLYNYIEVDALNYLEKQFVFDCETSDEILFYIKLPRTFVVKTPAGAYKPGWALIKKNNGGKARTYFVAETKDPKAVKNNTLQRESMKIICAEKHFEAVENVNYQFVSSVNDLKV